MRLLFNQGRLATRGAAEMVLNQVSACKGEAGDMIENTLKLGIAILRGGNIEVQTVNGIKFVEQNLYKTMHSKTKWLIVKKITEPG